MELSRVVMMGALRSTGWANARSLLHDIGGKLVEKLAIRTLRLWEGLAVEDRPPNRLGMHSVLLSAGPSNPNVYTEKYEYGGGQDWRSPQL